MVSQKLKEKKTNSSIKRMTTEVTKEPVPKQRIRKYKKVEEPQVEEPQVEVEVENVLEKQILSLKSTVNSVVEELVEKIKVLKSVEHELKKLSSTVKKMTKNKKPKKVSNSGFNGLFVISDELAEFLGVPKETQMRPPQVSSMINKYANENGLKLETDKTIYRCDDKLTNLLGPFTLPIKKSNPSLGLGLSMFNLNFYLKRHFTKPA